MYHFQHVAVYLHICLPWVSQLSLIYAVSLQIKQLSTATFTSPKKYSGKEKSKRVLDECTARKRVMLLNNNFRLYMELLNNNFKTAQQTRGTGGAKSSEPNPCLQAVDLSSAASVDLLTEMRAGLDISSGS